MVQHFRSQQVGGSRGGSVWHGGLGAGERAAREEAAGRVKAEVSLTRQQWRLAGLGGA